MIYYLQIVPEGVMPVTMVGWLTAIGLILTLAVQLVHLGIFFQKFKTVQESQNDFKLTLSIMDQHLDSLSQSLRDFLVEWRGQDGTNGARSRIKSLEAWRDVVEKRHAGEDAITRLEKELGGGQQRRLRDRLADEEGFRE